MENLGYIRKGNLCSLRNLDEDDGEALIQLCRQSEGFHRPWVYPPQTREAFESLFARTKSPNFFSLAVMDHSSASLCGIVNLSEIVYGGFQNAYIAFYTDVRFAGKGIMTEALKLAIVSAFLDLKLHRLEANLQPGNIPSKKLCLKCGMRYEGFSPRYLKINGIWRDHQRWAITVEDCIGSDVYKSYF